MSHRVIALALLLAEPVLTVRARVSVSIAAKQSNITGRLFIFVSTDPKAEPRRLVGDDISTQQLFGIDVVNVGQGSRVVLDETALGYPVMSLPEVPAGAYWLQAVLQPYHLYRIKGAPPVYLPRTEVNRFEGGDIFTSPGTFYSLSVHVNLSDSTSLELIVDQQDAPAPEPPLPRHDSKYIKHVSITSTLLSDFWGEPIQLEACVLLPWQFHEQPNATFPTFLYHGHYHDDWATPAYFSETSPPAGLTGYELVQAQYAYELYQNWTSGSGPFRGARGLIVTVKHPNPSVWARSEPRPVNPACNLHEVGWWESCGACAVAVTMTTRTRSTRLTSGRMATHATTRFEQPCTS